MQDSADGIGRRLDLAAELSGLGDPDLTGARVMAQHRGLWLVAPPGEPPRLAPARGRLRADGPPVTGDWVALDRDGAIAAVLERRGEVVRRAAGAPTAAQVLAANVDLALVAEPMPHPNLRRVERIAALATAGGVPSAVLLTKADLAPGAHEQAATLRGRLELADALAISALDGDGLGALRSMLAPGETGVLLGTSGAGKSTLLNALLGEDRQATAPVRAADGRGRHTTVGRELFALPGGALLVDTPGMREVGLWQGTGEAFGDIDALATRCRFADCHHDGEPGCAVEGAVDPERFAAWRKLAREHAWLEDRRTASRERERRGRDYTRESRATRRRKRG